MMQFSGYSEFWRTAHEMPSRKKQAFLSHWQLNNREDPTMSITAEYLKKAIIGESNAINKYRKFGEVAAKEGFPNVAYLFTATLKK